MSEIAFARVLFENQPIVVLVTKVLPDGVEGFHLRVGKDFFSDIFDVISKVPRSELEAQLRESKSKKFTQLLPPVEGRGTHLCAGLNYRDHAEETQATGPVLLFEKDCTPTGAQSAVETRPDWLLDFEVEIGVAWDRDLRSRDDVDAAQALVFLANDVSERATQIREFEPGTARGFKEAKSFPGFLPLGPVAIWPRNLSQFLKTLEIRCLVNGIQRQKVSATEMIKNPQQLLQVYWDSQEVFAARRLLLTGTPSGVILKAPAFSQKIKAVGGAFATRITSPELHKPFMSVVRDTLIRNLIEERRYLQPGDRVTFMLSCCADSRDTVLSPLQGEFEVALPRAKN